LSKLRTAVWAARDTLREHPRTPERARKCGQVRFTRYPQIRRCEGEGEVRAWWEGDIRCRSRLCPVCWVGKRAKTAAQISYVAEEWSKQHKTPIQMATLTVKHQATDSADLVLQVRDCWKAMLQGRSWQQYKKHRGTEVIAAEEITRGENGWHPHMHVLLLSRVPEMFPEPDSPFSDAVWWSQRWRSIVERKLGREHIPSAAHGVDLRPCNVAHYISKVGLELTDAADVKSRSPLDLLKQGQLDLYVGLQLLRTKRRDITWSRGLIELRDQTPRKPSVPLYTPAAIDWERGKDNGRLLPVLEMAEKGATEDELMRALWARGDSGDRLCNAAPHENTTAQAPTQDQETPSTAAATHSEAQAAEAPPP
jgi:hypothetical protein